MHKGMCINCLIWGLVHDGCYIGSRQVTFRPPASGSITDQGHQFLRSGIYQSTGNQGLCRLLLAGDWEKSWRFIPGRQGSPSERSLWLQGQGLMALSCLRLPYSAGQSRTLPCFLLFHLYRGLKALQPFLAPSSYSPQMFLLIKSLPLGVCFLENSLNTDVH